MSETEPAYVARLRAVAANHSGTVTTTARDLHLLFNYFDVGERMLKAAQDGCTAKHRQLETERALHDQTRAELHALRRAAEPEPAD